MKGKHLALTLKKRGFYWSNTGEFAELRRRWTVQHRKGRSLGSWVVEPQQVSSGAAIL